VLPVFLGTWGRLKIARYTPRWDFTYWERFWWCWPLHIHCSWDRGFPLDPRRNRGTSIFI